MKRIVFSVLMFFCFCGCFPQVKKNLMIKNNSQKKPAVTVEKKEEIRSETYEKALELFKLNKPQEAIPLFEKALEDENIPPEIWIHLGIAYYQAGEYSKSFACCTKGLSKKDTDHKILAYNAGNSAWALGNYGRAESCYSLALKEDENFAPAYLNRANARLKQDHLKDAREDYISYLDKDKNSPQKEEIEKLLLLLDEEIVRRENQIPEIVDIDFSAVKNEDMAVEEEKEKVNYEIPDENKKIEKNIEELVSFEIVQAPSLPVEPLEKIEFPAEEKVGRENIAETFAVEKEENTIPEVIVDKEIAMNSTSIENILKSDEAEMAENIGNEIDQMPLPQAPLTLPAGNVQLKTDSFGFSLVSPDKKLRKQFFSAAATNPQQVTSYIFEIVDENGSVVKTLSGSKLPEKLDWDGKDENGDSTEGKYSARLTVNYGKQGSVVSQSGNFMCFTEKPAVKLIPSKKSISPDEDGVEEKIDFDVDIKSQALVKDWNFQIKKENKTVYSKKGEGKPEKITWDGKTENGESLKADDSLTFSIDLTDSFGAACSDEGNIQVAKSTKKAEVAKSVELKENEDGTFDIFIPTLSFKINSSELLKTEKNENTLKQVYNILIDEQYEEYKVVITGYVNPDGKQWTKEEINLALQRAKSVEKYLIELGVNKKRLESKAGSGKTENKEYNRRVEFNLKK